MTPGTRGPSVPELPLASNSLAFKRPGAPEFPKARWRPSLSGKECQVVPFELCAPDNRDSHKRHVGHSAAWINHTVGGRTT